MSGLVEFAKEELNRLIKSCNDEEELNMQQVMNKDILDIVKLFSNQKHSGFSAQYALNMIKRLLDYKPLSDITDNDDEWEKLDYNDDIVYQCKRCPSLFKDKDNRIYNTEGKIFSDDNGHTWFTNKDSRIYVELPYTVPDKPEYVVIDNGSERFAIMQTISHILRKLGAMFDNALLDEDTLIASILPIHQFGVLQEKLIDYFYIVKPLFNLQEDETSIRMWNLINFVMKSDKEDPVKELD